MTFCGIEPPFDFHHGPPAPGVKAPISQNTIEEKRLTILAEDEHMLTYKRITISMIPQYPVIVNRIFIKNKEVQLNSYIFTLLINVVTFVKTFVTICITSVFF
jgi:hypothetical protein